MRGTVAAVMVALVAAPVAGWGADTLPARLEAARVAQARGDLPRVAIEIEAALRDLHARLGAALVECLPPVPAGWHGETAEVQALFNAGGGLSVSRAYSRDEASLNAQVILDNPAVAAASAQFQPTAALPTNARRIRIGGEDAVMRWDAATHSGEITLLLAPRLLMQIEGEGLTSGEPLIEAARGWNIGAIRKLIGT